jgi:hypothetical protein
MLQMAKLMLLNCFVLIVKRAIIQLLRCNNVYFSEGQKCNFDSFLGFVAYKKKCISYRVCNQLTAHVDPSTI